MDEKTGGLPANFYSLSAEEQAEALAHFRRGTAAIHASNARLASAHARFNAALKGDPKLTEKLKGEEEVHAAKARDVIWDINTEKK